MKPNDIVMVFGDPIGCTHPIDQARLIKQVSDPTPKIEQWWVEYLNEPGRQYIALIKKQDETKQGI